jgi:hypothetical protein
VGIKIIPETRTGAAYCCRLAFISCEGRKGALQDWFSGKMSIVFRSFRAKLISFQSHFLADMVGELNSKDAG